MKTRIIVLLILLLAGCSQDEKNISPQPVTSTSVENPVPVKATETDEEKAIRLAEEFVAINGYTDVPADKEHLTHETVEFYDNIDELLSERKNTLESKAYGVSDFGRMMGKGWTVVFRHKDYRFTDKLPENLKKLYQNAGRAVTMDESFQDLRVEHKIFPLGNARKKL